MRKIEAFATSRFRSKCMPFIVRRLGVRYFFESHPIIELASKQSKPVTSICAWCARMKRGILYKTARREGYNVLVLGQHLDDMVRSGGGCTFLVIVTTTCAKRTDAAASVEPRRREPDRAISPE